MLTSEQPQICSIKISGLFGLYTYTLPSSGQLSSAAILYGDNGVGKSTVLRLAFHLLSAAHNRGHRTALYSIQFEELHVELASGVIHRAVRNKKSPGILRLSISQGSKEIAVWDYSPGSSGRGRPMSEVDLTYVYQEQYLRSLRAHQNASEKATKNKSISGESIYISALEGTVPTVFILNAERRLDSDSVPDPSDEVELRQVMHYSEPKRIHDLVVKSREIALSQALSTAARWISNKAIHGANQGSMNVHSVYGNVLRHLTAVSAHTAETIEAPDIPDLLRRLSQIEAKTSELTQHELATSLSMSDFKRALTTRVTARKNLAANLVKPYIESLEGRLDAVEPIYQLLYRFLKIVNGMLSDKQLFYTLSSGFTIKNRLGDILQPAQLSSGEQQLLLLFCYVLTARDNPSVFMIDEPEISLNVKWQRLLIQSLLDITQDSHIQFIFASHSIELLAQHKNRVVKLVNTHAN